MAGISAAAVPAGMAAEKHYFLECFTTSAAVWGLRGICVLIGIAALVIYFQMKWKG